MGILYNLIACEEYIPRVKFCPQFSGIGRQRKGAAGVAKHLEFTAGGDQRITATREDNKSPAPQYHNPHTITIRMVIEVLGGSVGGFYKRFATPAAPSLCRITAKNVLTYRTSMRSYSNTETLFI
jgi:hypothetical protein